MRDRRGSLLGGLILVFIGVVMFAERLHFRFPSWQEIVPYFLIALGLASAYRIRGRGHRDGVFGAVFFLSLGAFFLLRRYDLIPYFHSWPMFPIAIGLGLLAQVLFAPNRFGVLIPAAVFLFFGCAGFLHEYDYWDFLDMARYWPVILIAFGISMLLNARRQRA